MKKTNLKLLAAMALPALVLSQQGFASFGPPPGFPNGNFPKWPIPNQQNVPNANFMPNIPQMAQTNQPMQNQHIPQFNTFTFAPPQINVPNQQNNFQPNFFQMVQPNQFGENAHPNMHAVPPQNAQKKDKNKSKQEMKPKKEGTSAKPHTAKQSFSFSVHSSDSVKKTMSNNFGPTLFDFNGDMQQNFNLQRIPVFQMDAPSTAPQQNQQMEEEVLNAKAQSPSTEEISGEYIDDLGGTVKWRYSEKLARLFISGNGIFTIEDFTNKEDLYKNKKIDSIFIDENTECIQFPAEWKENIKLYLGKRKNEITILGWSDNIATWVNSEGKEYFIYLDALYEEAMQHDKVKAAFNELLEKEGIYTTSEGGYKDPYGDPYRIDPDEDIDSNFCFNLNLNNSTFTVEFENSDGETIEFGPYNLPSLPGSHPSK